MKQKTIIILGLAMIFMLSCQNDIVPDINPAAEGDEVPVKVSLSMRPGIFHDTDYEPMSRAVGDDLPRVQISNLYTVLISKKIGNQWILEKNLKNKFNPADRFNSDPVWVLDDHVFHSFETDLRPGTYRMTVITGWNSLNWETYLVPGLVVEDEAGNIHPACTYRIVEKGYLNPGAKHIQEEIFSGCEPFDVIKTEDLHTPSPNQNVHIQMDRRVTKLRIFLRYEETSNGNNFYPSHNNGIVADLQLKSTAKKPFPNGLNVWGEVYFDPDDVLDNMKFGAFTWKQPQKGKDGNFYMLPMRNSTRQYSVFYFTEDKQELPVTVSKIEVTASTQINVNYVYACPEAETRYDTGSPIDIVLKHNTQHGIAFKPGEYSWDDPRPDGNATLRNMVLDVDGSGNPVDHSDLFPYAFEYDLTPQP